MTKISTSTLRTTSVLFFVALTVAGLGFKTGGGTLCALGYRGIAAICPLGAIEAMLASRTLLPRALISLMVMALIATAFGRVFCAWICPTPTLRAWLLGKSRRVDTSLPSEDAADSGLRSLELHPEGKISKVSLDSRHVVLGGALLSTIVFGFPVFCLVCPVGLTFATIIAIWRLIQYNEPSWSLLAFPGILVLELVICRKWCRTLCPLGALISLLSSMNVFFRPKVDGRACLRIAKGLDCSACKSSCAEQIDLLHVQESQPIAECTKCRACADICPVGAITFPSIPGESDSR